MDLKLGLFFSSAWCEVASQFQFLKITSYFIQLSHPHLLKRPSFLHLPERPALSQSFMCCVWVSISTLYIWLPVYATIPPCLYGHSFIRRLAALLFPRLLVILSPLLFHFGSSCLVLQKPLLGFD